MTRLVAIALVMLVMLVARPAAAACATPVRVPLAPGDLGVLPEACEATEVSLEGRGAALIATKDLYGSLLAGIGLRGRLKVYDRTWLSLWAPSLEYRFVANATVEADRASLGGGVLGVHHRIPLGERLSVAPFVRVLLPTETGFDRASRWGWEHGVSAVYRLRERLELASGFAFTLVSVFNGGSALSVLGESLTVDAVYRPWRVFGVAGGASLRTVWGDKDAFESFDPHLSARLYPTDALFIALSAALPLWGRDRTNVGLGLTAGWQF